MLRYDTPGSSRKDFWMFCTSEHLHPYGFTSKSDSTWFLEPPSSIVETHTYEEWKDLLESTPKNYDLPEELFHNTINHPKHEFKVGMKLEALSPIDQIKICPATIIKVFDDIYFLVHIDTYDELSKGMDIEACMYSSTEKNTWLCTAGHPYIFPIGWAKKHNIK